jgi:hypothetical protein
VHATAVVQAHFPVELRERVDAAETNVAVERLSGHEGALGAYGLERICLHLLQWTHQYFSRDNALYSFEGEQLRCIKALVDDVRD